MTVTLGRVLVARSCATKSFEGPAACKIASPRLRRSVLTSGELRSARTPFELSFSLAFTLPTSLIAELCERLTR